VTLCRESELLERIDVLEGEVAYWKSEATINVNHEQCGQLALALHLTTAESWILFALYRANGKVISRQRLMDEHPGKKEPDEREGNTVQVFVFRLRSKIGVDKILTAWGAGYRLSEAGIALCDQVLQP